jgi:hypothetical protein
VDFHADVEEAVDHTVPDLNGLLHREISAPVVAAQTG